MNDRRLPPPSRGKNYSINTDLIRQATGKDSEQDSSQNQRHQAKPEVHYHQYNTYTTEHNHAPSSPPGHKVAKTVALTIAGILGFIFVVSLTMRDNSDNTPTDATAARAMADAEAAADVATATAQETEDTSNIDSPEDLGLSDADVDMALSMARREAIVERYQLQNDDGSDHYYVMADGVKSGYCAGKRLVTVTTPKGRLPFETDGNFVFSLQLYNDDRTTGKMIVAILQAKKPSYRIQGIKEGPFDESKDDENFMDLRPADDVSWKNLPVEVGKDDGVPNYLRFKLNGIQYQMCQFHDGTGERQPFDTKIS